jgi:hypothetical protein
VFHKELYNANPNVTVWRVLQKRLHIRAYKLSVVQGVQQFQRFQSFDAFLKTPLKHPYDPVWNQMLTQLLLDDMGCPVIKGSHF